MTTSAISNHILNYSKDLEIVIKVLIEDADDDVEWDKLGPALGVAETEIQAIHDSKGSSSKKLKIMLTAWLQQGINAQNSKPSWWMLYKAVQLLGYSNIAEYIATQFSCNCEECQPVIKNEQPKEQSVNMDDEANLQQYPEQLCSEELIELLQAVKLNPNKWVEILSSIGVTTIDSLEKKMYRVLSSFADNQTEKSSLSQLLRFKDAPNEFSEIGINRLRTKKSQVKLTKQISSKSLVCDSQHEMPVSISSNRKSLPSQIDEHKQKAQNKPPRPKPRTSKPRPPVVERPRIEEQNEIITDRQIEPQPRFVPSKTAEKLEKSKIKVAHQSPQADQVLISKRHTNKSTLKLTTNLEKQQNELLKLLDFQKYYPQKLSLQEALMIDDDRKKCSIHHHGTNDGHKLLFLMLEKIKKSDCTCRLVLLYDQPSLADDGESSDEEPDVLVHPMDALLVLLLCCDGLLRQDLFLRLNTAQLAIPLLLPDPFSGTLTLPLWSMRSIIKNWKCRKTSAGESQEGRIVDCEIPMISFLRLSHPGFSKSAILNAVISGQHIFFDHFCEGSGTNRCLIDGLVEACWYLPSGEETDHFDDILTFANFRGNAGHYDQQFKFLSTYSAMLFIFMTEDDIDQYINDYMILHLSQIQSKIFFVLKFCSKMNKSRLKSAIPASSVIELKNTEPAKIAKTIQSKIVSRLDSTETLNLCQLSNLELSKLNISTDEENDRFCQLGCKLANETMSYIDKVESRTKSEFKVKGEVVPLQGPDLWHKWAKIDKSHHRTKREEMGQLKVEEFNKKKRLLKKKRRKEQLDVFNRKDYSRVMTSFIEVLIKHNQIVKSYYLQWLKFRLDDRSNRVLPHLQEKCRNARKELSKEKQGEGNEKYEQIQKQLKRLDEELILASFGVEHLFRELGQIYECNMEFREHISAPISSYPELAAKLLFSGYPLEIIDGDAAHIPQTWVEAVFLELKKLMNTQKICVLSVLGIQSSGKSTLLNTLFGIRFAVSAGRCTRGAYMQLVKMNLSIDKKKCDYVLVIDTEGLRAPELDSQETHQHDNELAALVIGLAGITIINIQGEVPAEINDILQTTVHAFLRMKKVELKPSCQFVRHHVSTVGASKTKEGNVRFQSTLDEMTMLAAKAEHCEAQFQRFSDVINFNNEEDILNFPGLWAGNPPMAPVNPAYCETAEKLKTKLISRALESICTMDEFIAKIGKLWDAVLRENFVFSFKNILEVEAFAKLDAEYAKWSWRLRSRVINWQKETQRIITAAATDDDAEMLQRKQVEKVSIELNTEYTEVMKDAKCFFENTDSTHAQRMIQWRDQYFNKLKLFRDDLRDKADVFCRKLIKNNKAQVKFIEMKQTQRKRIEEEIKSLVSKLNIKKDQKLTDADMQRLELEFTKKWNIWMEDIQKDYPLGRKVSLNHTIETIITQQLCKFDSMILHELQTCPLEQRGDLKQFIIDLKRHLIFQSVIKKKGLYGIVEQALVDGYEYVSGKHSAQVANVGACQKQSEIKTAEFFAYAEKYLQNAMVQQGDTIQVGAETFFESHFTLILSDILAKINEFEKNQGRGKFSFSSEYRVDIALEIGGYMLKEFDRIQDEAMENHPVTYLNSLRRGYSEKFKALCNQSAAEKAAAISLVDIVAEKSIKALHENTALALANDMKSNNHIFSSKKTLKGEILLKLVDQNNFKLYALHISNISQSYLIWIKQYTKEHCDKVSEKYGKAKIAVLAQIELDKIIQKIKEALDESVKQASNIEQWLTSFRIHLAGVIELVSESDLQDLVQIHGNSGKIDLKFFTKQFNEELDRFYKGITPTSFLDHVLDMDRIIKDTSENLLESIAGCCAQCPFCKEQCEMTDKQHSNAQHFCTLHRPQCLGGFKRRHSQEMVLDICTDDVRGDGKFSCQQTNGEYVPYKQYQDIFPDWIIPDEGGAAAPYWKWFTAHYTKEIAEHFEFKECEISEDWKCLGTEDAKSDIKTRYKC